MENYNFLHCITETSEKNMVTQRKNNMFTEFWLFSPYLSMLNKCGFTSNQLDKTLKLFKIMYMEYTLVAVNCTMMDYLEDQENGLA